MPGIESSRPSEGDTASASQWHTPTADRRRADQAKHELAQELAASKLLQSISTQLIEDQPVETLYARLAAAASTLLRSDFASMQLLDSERDVDGLRLLAHRGFSDEAAAYWAWVPRDANSSCGAAMRAGHRVIVPDVELSGFTADSVRAYLDAGIRSAQSTPLYGRDGRLVGMLSTHWRTPHIPSERELSLLDILARQAADLIERRRAGDALRDAHDLLERKVDERTREVRDLLARLITSQEEERRRMSRQIHDAVGQQITALRLNLELLAGTAISEHVFRSQRLAEELDRSIDVLAWELRPATLDDLGLSAALQALVVEWSERFGIAAGYQDSAIDTGAGAPRLERDVETNIYRVVQEALHNIHKHARATCVGVVLARRQAEMTITIEDDGCGFAVEWPGQASKQLGLIGMRERAALIGAEFHIDSSPGRGTKATLRLPFH